VRFHQGREPRWTLSRHTFKETGMARFRRGGAALGLVACLGTILSSEAAASPEGLLTGPIGTTALAGLVQSADGKPLANIALSDGHGATRTDSQGRFLLEALPAGASVMRIDGRHGGANGDIDYGTYEVQVHSRPHVTTDMPFISWLTPIDHSTDVVLASPTTREVVLTTPKMPGLEIHIPPGTVVTDWDGHRIDRVSLTPVSPTHAPFPTPSMAPFPSYFTAQPGGARLWTVDGARAAARVVYPNVANGGPGARTMFWHYEPGGLGWVPYGGATVTADAKQVVPDKGVAIYDFMGGGTGTNNAQPPSQGTNAAAGPGATKTDGEPVDLGSGFFTLTATDMSIADTIPISVTRSYMSSDQSFRDFGLGMSLSYNMYLNVNANAPEQAVYAQLNLETPTSSVPFTNTAPLYGNFNNSVFVESTYPGPFQSATAVWNGNGFKLQRRDGVTYGFGLRTSLEYMQDRFGNRVSLEYQAVVPSTHTGISEANDAYNRLTAVSSPNGKSFTFTYTNLFPTSGAFASPDGLPHYAISQAVDNLGRTVNYGYDGCGRLTSITDAHAVATGSKAATTLTWVPALSGSTCPSVPSLLASVTDANGNLIVSSTYEVGSSATGYGTTNAVASCQSDSNFVSGRVCQQTLAAPSGSAVPIYSFQYTVDTNENIQSVLVTDPLQYEHKVDFGLGGAQVTAPAQTTEFPLDETWAYTSSIAQTWTYSRNATNQLTSVTAPVLPNETAGRVTMYDYDSFGNITEVIQNYVSGGANTTTQNLTTKFAYSPNYNQVDAITDPNKNVTFLYRDNALEEVTIYKDPNGNRTILSYFADGQVKSSVRAATATQNIETDYAYTQGDLTSVTQVIPSGTNRVSTVYKDALSRPILQTDPLGDSGSSEFDPVFGPISAVDPNGNATSFAYDPVGNLSSVTTPLNSSGQSTVYQYQFDDRNRLQQYTDPLGHSATYVYDADSNLICTDDRNGHEARFTFDQLNRAQTTSYYTNSTACGSTAPSQLESSVTYGFDSGNRLLTVADTLGGTTTRMFDDVDRLTSDQQASVQASIGTVTYGYDAGSRRTAMTFTPAGASATQVAYAYDPANNLLGIQQGSSAVCMTYDEANRRVAMVYPDGVTATDALDEVSELTGRTYTVGGSAVISGTTVTCTPGTQTGPGTLSYTYDQGGRQVTRGGSLFTLVAPAVTSGLAYNQANQMTTMQGGYAAIYDNNGNQTCRYTTSATICRGAKSSVLAWDVRNRLKQVTVQTTPSNVSSYVYDGLSRRQTANLAPTAGAQVNTYLYDGLNPLGQAITGANARIVALFNGLGLDERYAQTDTLQGAASYLTDVQGSTTAITQNAALTSTYSYPAFGSNATSAYATSFLYTGREEDGASGLYYMRGRYYDPAQARFVSEDPSGLAAGPNIYAYANNDPLDLIDPLGLCGGPSLAQQLAAGGILVAGNIAIGAEEFFSAGVATPAVPAEEAGLIALAAGVEGSSVAVAATETAAAEGVVTPYGIATQELSPAALDAQTAVSNGATLYRGGVLGQSAGPEAQFWSLESPLSPGYAERYGIPAENMNFDFIESGTLNPGTNFITRSAPGIGANGGGAIEVVTPSGGVTLNLFSMP